MAQLINFDTYGAKTYATRENAIKAVEKKFGNENDFRYLVIQDNEGRWFPVAIGEKAVLAGAHFYMHVIN